MVHPGWQALWDGVQGPRGPWLEDDEGFSSGEDDGNQDDEEDKVTEVWCSCACVRGVDVCESEGMGAAAAHVCVSIYNPKWRFFSVPCAESTQPHQFHHELGFELGFQLELGHFFWLGGAECGCV